MSWRGDGALGGPLPVAEVRAPDATATPLETLGFRPGALLLRVTAALLDYTLLAVLIAFAQTITALAAGIDPALPRAEMEVALEPLLGLLYAVTFGVYLAFQTICNAAGSSPGKRLCGLRIIDVRGRAPGLWRGFLRALWSVASSMPPWLGYFAVTWDSERRAWHDRLSGTWVVRRRRD